MRRLFWVALGLGAGAAGAVLTTRFARKQMQKVAPSTIAREARGGLLELTKLVSESIAEGRRAMERAEAEARGQLADAEREAGAERSSAER